MRTYPSSSMVNDPLMVMDKNLSRSAVNCFHRVLEGTYALQRTMVLRVSEAAGREMGVTGAALVEASAQVRASDAAAATAARAAAMDRMRASRQRQRAMQETTSQQQARRPQTLASARAVGKPAAAAAAVVDSATRGFYNAFQMELLAQTQAPAAAPVAVQLEDGAAVQAQQPAGGGWDNPVEVDDDEEDHLATHI